MRTKQEWVDLLFEVQLGDRSCRNMADLIMDAIESQSIPWKCPIDFPECRENCGGYGCRN